MGNLNKYLEICRAMPNFAEEKTRTSNESDFDTGI